SRAGCELVPPPRVFALPSAMAQPARSLSRRTSRRSIPSIRARSPSIGSRRPAPLLFRSRDARTAPLLPPPRGMPSAPQRAGQGTAKRLDCGLQVGRSALLLHDANQGAPDDHAVGERGDRLRLLRPADAEPHRDRQPGDATSRANLLGQLLRQVLASARDTGARNEVDEALCFTAHPPDALAGGGPRQQSYLVQ